MPGASLATSIHPAAPHALPGFITAPGETDTFMVVMAIFLVIVVLTVGVLFLRLHTLPERIAHSSQKLQFEIVAVLGLLALFTHIHLFWVAGLILALIDIPDWGTPLRRIAGSTEKIAGLPPGPIANPGLSSIRAALYPAHTDYLYFVARNDGTHIFTRSFAEHERAIAEVKRMNAEHRDPKIQVPSPCGSNSG